MFVADDERATHRTEMNLTQFVLEYIHAVLSSSHPCVYRKPYPS
jgi:hypothetical protein